MHIHPQRKQLLELREQCRDGLQRMPPLSDLSPLLSPLGLWHLLRSPTCPEAKRLIYLPLSHFLGLSSTAAHIVPKTLQGTRKAACWVSGWGEGRRRAKP